MNKQREVVKRVIAFMTVGIDLSRLFPEMVMSCNTRDVVQKKLVYLYLTTYAESHPDLSLLAVNTLQKDVTDTNPMIRGLALRHLCSLRLPDFLEYMIPPVDNGLRDPAPYVRKTAALAVAKLHRLSPQVLKRQNTWVGQLYDLVADRDPAVAHNALAALQEVLLSAGGPSVTRTLAMHLFSRVSEFNPWAMCLVLQIALRHSPTEDDLYDILNVLEDRLKLNNPTVIFAVLQAFLHLTDGLPIREQVYGRLVGPLITVLSSAGPEEAWTCLHHARLLATVAPQHFSAHYKHFFCRYNDTSAVKVLKVDILTDIASEANAQQIVEELSEYIREGDHELGKRAVAAIGRIAAGVPQAESSAVFVAQDLLGAAAHGGAWAGLGLSLALALLRRSPAYADTLLPPILSATNSARLEDTEARGAYVWVLGEYGDRIGEAPYLLEELVPTYAELPAALKLQLLSAAMKLLFKRAPEMQPVMGQLLHAALDDSSNVDVRDRALLYYRLLRQHLSQARQIFLVEKDPIGAFTEETHTELYEELLAEFNSLAVVYGLPSHRFPRPPTLDIRPTAGSAGAPAVSSTVSVEQDEKPAAPFTTAAKAQSLLGEEGPLVLRPRATMDSRTFQEKWAALPVAHTWEAPISASADWSSVEARMSAEQVMCMASGSVGGVHKYYFFAQEDRSSAYFVVEVVGETAKGRLTARFKTETERALPHFTRHFKLALSRALALN